MCLNQLLAVEEEQAKIVNLSFVHLFIEEQVYFFFKKKKKKGERERERCAYAMTHTAEFPR